MLDTQMPVNKVRDDEKLEIEELEDKIIEKDAVIKELAWALKEAAGNEKDLYVYNKYTNLANKYL